MIDLNKPIRRKGGDPVRVEDGFYIVHPPSGYIDFSFASFATREELERDYENIPEPRKARRFWADAIYCKNLFGMRDHTSTYEKTLHLIDWPENAPIPDWPEGYE